ncbi:MAG: hypothetical protein ABFE07_00595 [Armatimonadia bacterium]
MIDINTLPKHSYGRGSKQAHGGYIYILELSTGLVKVGKTRSPRDRIKSHLDSAARFGASITNFWISDQHDNFSDNEAALIAALGNPVHGAEFFRVTYPDAKAIATSLDFHRLTDEERRSKDEISSARAAAKAMGLVHDGGDYVRIKVLADEAGPLQLLYSSSLPNGFEPSSDEERTHLPSLILNLSEKSGIPIEEIETWSYIEVMEHIAVMAIRVQALRLTNRALLAGRYDLTQPAIEMNWRTA